MDQTTLTDVEILLVEDDDFEAKAVRRAFREARVRNNIVRVENGLEALDVLHGRDPTRKVTHPVLLLVDLNMPRMNGLEFILEIRKDPKFRKLVIFVLTTSSDEKDIAAAYDLNVAGYIVKSTVVADFTALTSLVGGFWTTIQMPNISTH